MAHILLVDDEQNVLNALRRELEGEHDVEAFTSPRQALERARDTEFDLVMADYRMPEMDGASFLELFAQSQPDAMRLILSGQADMDALIKTINISHPYRFVAKPWSKFDLEADIKQSLDYREAMLENRRLAAACQERYVSSPPARACKIYRILLATNEANDAALIVRELTTPAFMEEGHGSGFPGVHGCFPLGGADFQPEVECFTTQQQVLGQLESGAYDLVIVDSLMLDKGDPGFLDEIRARSPESAHILISGTVDMDVLANAINRIQVDDFIRRPWKTCELKAVVLRALRYRDLRQENCRLANLFRQHQNLTGHPN